MTALLILGGLVLLLAGGELLVRGASQLAGRFAIPPLVIGLTVVAFGTSAPELAVSLGAALDGRTNLALGNVVGSNILNVLFILGLAALITPLRVSLQLVRREVPIMIGASVLVPLLGWNGAIDRWEGALLVALGITFTVFQVREGRRAAPPNAELVDSAPTQGQAQQPRESVLLDAGMIVLGLVALVFGSRWLVAGAVTLARGLGVGEMVIGLTLVAAGTSLPEVATSVMASLRGEREIAVGNVVGSNIFNILWVLGATSALSPRGVEVAPTLQSFDIPLMIVAALACLPIFFTGLEIARWEGGLFLIYYVAYTALMIFAARQSTVVPSMALLGFAAPLIGVTLYLLLNRTTRR